MEVRREVVLYSRQCGIGAFGASTLPVGFVAVALALMVVTRAGVRPVRWHDRLAANRLFRPPRLLG